MLCDAVAVPCLCMQKNHLWKLQWQVLQLCMQQLPGKACTGVLFAARCNVFMPCDVREWIVCCKLHAKLAQGLVLRSFKVQAFKPFQLDADGIVIAVFTATPLRFAGMPGTVVTADKLPELTFAGDEKVRGNFKPANALKVGVRIPVELVGEQLLHAASAVLAGRQTDGVHHGQRDGRISWAWAKVGGGLLACAGQPALMPGSCGKSVLCVIQHIVAVAVYLFG